MTSKYLLTRKMAAFRGQKNGARRRGIGFEFTFPEWCKWWENHLGPNWLKLRGNKSGQYVMARFKDEGPYREGNVEAITCNENGRQIDHKKQINYLYVISGRHLRL